MKEFTDSGACDIIMGGSKPAGDGNDLMSSVCFFEYRKNFSFIVADRYHPVTEDAGRIEFFRNICLIRIDDLTDEQFITDRYYLCLHGFYLNNNSLVPGISSAN